MWVGNIHSFQGKTAQLVLLRKIVLRTIMVHPLPQSLGGTPPGTDETWRWKWLINLSPFTWEGSPCLSTQDDKHNGKVDEIISSTWPCKIYAKWKKLRLIIYTITSNTRIHITHSAYANIHIVSTCSSLKTTTIVPHFRHFPYFTLKNIKGIHYKFAFSRKTKFAN